MAVTNILFFSSISYYILPQKESLVLTHSRSHFLSLLFPFFVHVLCLIWKSLFFGDEKVKIRERIKKAQKKTLAQTKHNMAAHNEQMNDQTNKQTHRQTHVHVCMQPTKAIQWKKTMFSKEKLWFWSEYMIFNSAFFVATGLNSPWRLFSHGYLIVVCYWFCVIAYLLCFISFVFSVNFVYVLFQLMSLVFSFASLFSLFLLLFLPVSCTCQIYLLGIALN